MSIDAMIAAVIYAMAQIVIFGCGSLAVLATPLTEQAMLLMPWVAIVSFTIAVPTATALAPRLKARVEPIYAAPDE